MEKRLDPARVMPHDVFAKVLDHLDPDTLRRTRSVSRGWSERAGRHAALHRGDGDVSAPTIAQVSDLHAAPLVFFAAKFWTLCLGGRPSVLFDVVRLHPDTARPQVLLMLRMSAVVLLAVPLFALGGTARLWSLFEVSFCLFGSFHFFNMPL